MSPELAKKLAGRRVVASVSGGKDSSAMSLWLTEQEIEHDRVFLDTGWEHDITYEYLRGSLTEKLGPILEVRGVDLMEDLIVRKGTFPSRLRRFCTQELKVYPMQRYLNTLVKDGADLINAVGIRAEESAARSQMPEWEHSEGFDCEVWRPMIRWTFEEVVAIHARHGLKPNPLYMHGASRVGCFPCIYAAKDEIRLIADLAPERIDRIRALEANVTVAAEKRWWRDRVRWRADPQSSNPEVRAKKFARLFERSFQAPAWFQAQSAGPDGHYPMVPIDDVVKWARTSYGGKQFEFFAASGRDSGCMRWGLCETQTPAQPVAEP